MSKRGARYVLFLSGLLIIVIAFSGCTGDNDKEEDDDDDDDTPEGVDYEMDQLVITPTQKNWSAYEKEGKYYEDDDDIAHIVKGGEYFCQDINSAPAKGGEQYEPFEVHFYVDDNYIGMALDDFGDSGIHENFNWVCDLDPGEYKMKAILDPDEKVKDPDRSNNEVEITFIVDEYSE